MSGADTEIVTVASLSDAVFEAAGEDQAPSHSIPRFDPETPPLNYDHLFATVSDSGDAPGTARRVLPKYTQPRLPRFSSSSRSPIDTGRCRNEYRSAPVAFGVQSGSRAGRNPHAPVFHDMAIPNFRLEDLAYGKLNLHTLKYPLKTVNGVFIGSIPSSGLVIIEDAVPLQHHWTNFSPMMEVGLEMVPSSPLFFSSYFSRINRVTSFFTLGWA